MFECDLDEMHNIQKISRNNLLVIQIDTPY